MSAGRALALLLLCGLAACQPVRAPTVYSGRLPQPSAIKLQRLTDGGDYIHRDTGFVFPDRLGELKRESITIATENADDVGGSYMVPGRQDFLGTAMLFPIWNVVDRQLSVSDVPVACEDAFLDARDAALQRLRNPRIVKEEAIPSPRFKDAVFTRLMVFEADGGENLADVPIRSELYWQCGIGKVWVVLHRISYVSGSADLDDLARAVVDGAPQRP